MTFKYVIYKVEDCFLIDFWSAKQLCTFDSYKIIKFNPDNNIYYSYVLTYFSFMLQNITNIFWVRNFPIVLDSNSQHQKISKVSWIHLWCFDCFCNLFWAYFLSKTLHWEYFENSTVYFLFISAGVQSDYVSFHTLFLTCYPKFSMAQLL